MKMDVAAAAIVLVGDPQTPLALDRDFLVDRHIVPSDWQLSGPAIKSPIASSVAFSNGVVVSVTGDRLSVEQKRSSAKVKLVGVDKITSTLVRQFALARYRAIGFNHVAISPSPVEPDYVRRRFFKEDRLATLEGYRSQSASFTVLIDLKDTVLTLAVQSATMEPPDAPAPLPALFISGNYHVELSNLSSADAVERISHYGRTLRHFEKIVEQLTE